MRLSKTAIGKFRDCPRCFWLKYRHKLGQPEGISSKVWKGIERITIAHYEAHRLAKTTPPNLIGQVSEGAIPYQADRIEMKALRYWGKGLRFLVEGIEVTTALDDMLQWSDPKNGGGPLRYAVIDYKSKSKPTDHDATVDLYQDQADVFDLACNLNGYPTDGLVYFDYWHPVEVRVGLAPDGLIDTHGRTIQVWGSQVIALKADHERIKKLVLAAAACLDSAMPEPRLREGKKPGCSVCDYVAARAELFKTLEAGAPA